MRAVLTAALVVVLAAHQAAAADVRDRAADLSVKDTAAVELAELDDQPAGKAPAKGPKAGKAGKAGVTKGARGHETASKAKATHVAADKPAAAEVAVLGELLVSASDGEPGSTSGNSSNETDLNATAVFDPKRLKKPFHKHMEHNRDGWAKKGGWSQGKQTALHKAKLAFHKAKQDLIKQSSDKEVVDMGCPCPGEKYYNLVTEGNIETNANMSAVNETANEMLNATAHAERQRRLNATRAAAAADSALVKRMRAKYGKLGPNSAWQPHHEHEVLRAKQALKSATVTETALFKVAKPEFQKLKEEDPAFFTNGDCNCPASWTKQDAALLAAREAKDLEDSYWREKRKASAYWNDISGENERLSAEEAKGDPDPEEEAAMLAAKGDPVDGSGGNS